MAAAVAAAVFLPKLPVLVASCLGASCLCWWQLAPKLPGGKLPAGSKMPAGKRLQVARAWASTLPKEAPFGSSGGGTLLLLCRCRPGGGHDQCCGVAGDPRGGAARHSAPGSACPAAGEEKQAPMTDCSATRRCSHACCYWCRHCCRRCRCSSHRCCPAAAAFVATATARHATLFSSTTTQLVCTIDSLCSATLLQLQVELTLVHEC